MDETTHKKRIKKGEVTITQYSPLKNNPVGKEKIFVRSKSTVYALSEGGGFSKKRVNETCKGDTVAAGQEKCTRRVAGMQSLIKKWGRIWVRFYGLGEGRGGGGRF